MPPYLHPRSRLTTSLFGATLAVSFLVVGMPHIIPCPAPRIVMADTDLIEGQDGRWRRTVREGDRNELEDEEDEAEALLRLAEQRKRLETKGHECPIPKPGGILGEVLGLGNRTERIRKTRPEVVVQKE